MQTETEATFLKVDHEATRTKLRQLGATIHQPAFEMVRAVYDFEDLRLDQQAAWIRVRQEADKVTMTFKQRLASTIDGMREIELAVDDFDKTCEFLEAIGLMPKAKQATRREVWELDDCEIMLDEWPWIPPFLEIEGASEEVVKATAEKLGLDYSQALFDSIDAVYQRYYDVSRTEISTTSIDFGPVPAWLEAKRR